MTILRTWLRSLLPAVLVTACFPIVAATQNRSADVPKASPQQLSESYGRLPLSFEVNQGQTDAQVKFLSRHPGFVLFLTPAETVLAFSDPAEGGNLKTSREAGPVNPRKVLTSALRVRLVGANPTPSIDGLEELATRSNYFIGNDPKKWQTNVPNYAKVKYESVYPGVDVVYYGNHRQLEHDFIVAPGADPRAITLGFDRRERLRIDERGDVVVKGGTGEVRLEKPVIYQEVGGVRRQVSGGYVRKGREIGFWVGKYDLTEPLVIDPVLSYSTFASSALSSGAALGTGIAVDASGNAYVVGTTNSPDFPTSVGAYQTTLTSGTTLFVMKLNNLGSAVIYSTYVGNQLYNNGFPGPGIAVDSAGSAYLTGSTSSTSFPTTPGAFQTSLVSGAVANVFVTKLDPTGSQLVYSTYLGGWAADNGAAIAVDSSGAAYVTGESNSDLAACDINGTCSLPPFPITPGAFETTIPGGSSTCFVTKLNQNGTGLDYSTWLASTDSSDRGLPSTCEAIALDSSGSAYVTGYTEQRAYPTTSGAFQTYPSPASVFSAFVTKLTPDGSGLTYSTYLTGNANGSAAGGIAVDSAGSAYVTGAVGSPNSSFSATSFPTTPGALQTTFAGPAGAGDFFISKLTADGSGVIYSTYLGIRATNTFYCSNSACPSIAVDSAGSASVAGTSISGPLGGSIPTTPDAVQTANRGAQSNAFVSKLTADGSGLLYSTYLGGSGQTFGLGVAVDVAGATYVTGNAGTNDFPTTAGSVYPVYGGLNASGFVAKFDFSQPSVSLSPPSLTFPATTIGLSSSAQTVTFSAGGAGELAFNNIGVTGTNAGDFTLSTNTCGATLAANASCQVQVALTPTGTGTRSATLAFNDDVSGSPQSVTLTGTGVTQTTTTTTLASSLNPAPSGQSVTFTATVTPATSGVPTGSVTFYDGASVLGTTLLSGNPATATFTSATLAVGAHSITANYSGDTNFLSSPSASAVTETIAVTVPPAFTSSNAATFLVGTPAYFTFIVSGSPFPTITLSGSTPPLPASLTFTPGTGANYATINGTPASTDVGTYVLTITASNFAASVNQSFTLTIDLNQTISLVPVPNHFAGDAPFAVTATASSGLPVILAVSGDCTLNGSTSGSILTVGATPGGCTLTAAQQGNSTYAAATAVSESFNIIAQPASCPANVTSSQFVNTAYTDGTIPFFGGESAGLATDPAGDVYVAQNPVPFQTAAGGYYVGASPSVLMVSPNGSTQTLPAPPGGFGEVTAVGFYNGILYVADGIGYTPDGFPQATPQNAIWAYNPSSGVWTEPIYVNNPTGIAFWNGNIYVSSWQDEAVYAFSPTGATLGTVWKAPDPTAAPYGLAFDGNGDLFIAGFGAGNYPQGSKIFEVLASDVAGYTQNSSIFFDLGLPAPTALAFDAFGNLFASYYNQYEILKIAPSGSSSVVPMSVPNGGAPNGLAFDVNNNLFTVLNDSNIGGIVAEIQGAVCSPTVPVITWPTPSPILYGAALSTTQLDASAADASNNPIAGTFVYTPALNSIPNPGVQTLSTTFTPTDMVTYSSATATVQLTVNQAPAFTSPASTTFTVATAGSFPVTATGYPQPTLSVSSGQLPTGVQLVSAPSPGLAGTPAVGSGGVYNFSITATNGITPSATLPFALTVNEAPTITSAASAAFTVGTQGSFPITATGYPAPITFSETGALPAGGVNLSSAGVLSGTPAAGSGGTYPISVTASNGIGSSAPQPFTLTVDQAPGITTNPVGQTVATGSSATFTAAASGYPTPTVQWQVSTGGGPFANIGGATSTTLTLSAVTQSINGNHYQAVFTNGIGSAATTTAATLTVNFSPSVTTQPSSTTVTAGLTATFVAAASGNPTPTVQWQVSTGGGPFANISGATSTTLTLNVVTASMNGSQYQAVFSNGIGTAAATTAATLTVNFPPSVTTQPSSTTVTAGQTATFTATASGNPTPTVQWQVSTGGGPFTNISGATLATLTLNAVTASMNGNRYQAVFSNGISPAATTTAATLTVNSAAPTLTSISPNSELRGTSQAVTLTGTGFVTGLSVVATPAAAGFTISNVQVVNATAITATFASTTATTIASVNISVATATGTSNPQPFGINSGPMLGSVSPSSGSQGTVVNATLTGTGLTGASAVTVSGGGITVSALTVVSDTTVTATFTISPTAAVNARNVTVRTLAGTSNAILFAVSAPSGPTLTSISPLPNAELRGSSATVTLTGTNFVTGSNVVTTPAAAGFTISKVVVVNAATITATFASNTAAAIGNVNIEVVTPGGGSNTLPFAITGPVLTGISTASANRGSSSVPITLTGSGLTGTTAINVSGNGITVSSLSVVNDTTVTATLAISAGASAGARNVTVTAPGGTSDAVTFTVTVPAVGLTSISPTTGARGTTQAVTLTGVSFQTGANPATGIALNGGGITVSAFTVVNDTTITAAFTIAPTAALTARNVTVTTAAGPTTPVTFTVVNPGTPILSSISPASGLRSTAVPVPVTLTGSNFTAGSIVNVVTPANGLTVTGVMVVSPTQINATFNTTNTAAIGPRSITVTTPGGTSGSESYTVTGPVLTSISPTSALRGQGAAVPVEIFGSGLTGASAVTVSGGGITVGPITVVSDMEVQTTFTISAGASGTVRNVSVTAPGGVSNTVALTVTLPPTPTLANVNPPTGVSGTVVPVMLTGTNFIAGETTVTVSGSGVTVSGVSVTSPSTLTATLTISATASIGLQNVTVTVAGAAAFSNTLPFTVQGPTLTSINPNSATHPATGTLAVPITVNGANLTGATGLTGLPRGVTLASGTFTVVNSTTITATLNVSSTATTGARNLGVATPIGTTNTIPFTVN